MPAIDPNRLRRQIEELRLQVGDPSGLRRSIVRLVEEYSDRTRRQGRRESTVPGSVHRSVLQALQEALANDPDAAAQAAEALWRAEPTEAKLLAAGLLGPQHGSFAADLAERWATQGPPAKVIEAVGEFALTGWRRGDPGEFLQRAQTWLGDRNRLLALYSLRSAVRDPEFEDLPAVFQLLSGLAGGVRGESKRAFVQLIHALEARAPRETARFLDEEVQTGDPNPAWMTTLLKGSTERSPR